MARKKIVLQTNGPWLKTGLGENGRYLMKHLLKTGKYEVVYFCTNNVMSNDPNLGRLPCKAYGAIPADQNIINQLNQDPGRAAQVAYGAHFIDQIIKDEKPDIWWESDDIWSTNGYLEKPWFSKINSVFHKTPDSKPIMDEAYKQARATPYFTTWAEFAVKEMKRVDPKLTHIRHIYGMFDINHFSPLTKAEKADLRKRFGIDRDTVIFHTTNRNQLRKCFVQTIEAFALFKREYPTAKAKLHFHTSFSERGGGWDIMRLAEFHGIKKEDILCTYVCRNCGQWHIHSYVGEDIDCPYCGAKKSMITPTVHHGVPDEEMKLMHGVFDAGLSIFDSGGLERFSVSSLLCGLPTAISSYSCGEDFMNLPFVYPVEWAPYYQPGSNFMKATPKIESLKNFMVKVFKMKESERLLITEQGRDWAIKTFSCETIGKQWEKMFDEMPSKDWSTITLEFPKKNAAYPMPNITDSAVWVKDLYKNILNMEVNDEDSGFKNWMSQLANNVPRERIYQYFIHVANTENEKNQPPKDFGEIFDKNDRKRLLYVMKESAGDIFISTATLKGLKELYPDTDIYFACDPKFFELLAGNEYIYKTIPYHQFMESELMMIPYVQYYYFPALPTQRQLAYLTKDKIGIELDENKTAR